MCRWGPLLLSLPPFVAAFAYVYWWHNLRQFVAKTGPYGWATLIFFITLASMFVLFFSACKPT